MKTHLAILTIFLVVCASHEIKISDERLERDLQLQDALVNGDNGKYQNDQGRGRDLGRDYGNKKTRKMSSSKKSSSQKSSSKNSEKWSPSKNSEKWSPSKNSEKWSPSKNSEKKYNSFKKSGEDEHEVFIQTLTCPGECLTLVNLPGADPYVSHEVCDNCDPNQKWRINKYKGNLVQLEHVKTGECACIVEDVRIGDPVFPDAGVCGDVLKLGPCHKYGKITDRSVFSFEGGQFYSQFCMERGFASQLSQSPNPADFTGLCGADEDGIPYPIFLYPTVVAGEDGDPVYAESLFMVTECLLNPSKCYYDWW